MRFFGKAVAMECAAAGDGIRSTRFHPGVIDTPIWTKIPASTGSNAPTIPTRWRKPKYRSAGLAKRETSQMGVLFLASDASSYMTGGELVIDGGMTGGARPRWS